MRVVLSTKFAGSVAIVQLQGRLTLSPMLRRLKPMIEKTLDGKSPTGLVLSLAGVPDADSSGLGELVAIHTLASKRRTRIAITDVNTRIRDLFEMTRLDGLFTICDSEASAL